MFKNLLIRLCKVLYPEGDPQWVGSRQGRRQATLTVEHYYLSRLYEATLQAREWVDDRLDDMTNDQTDVRSGDLIGFVLFALILVLLRRVVPVNTGHAVLRRVAVAV